MKKLTTNRQLAALAVLLATGALIAGLAFPDGPGHANEGPRFVSVLELAERIKSREELTLIDLREEELYEEFHLPTAVNVPLHQIQANGLEAGAANVFYSGDDLLTRHLWISLPKEVKAHSAILYGGVHDWYNYLLYPTLPLTAHGEDSVVVEKVNELTRFYGGQAEFAKDSVGASYYTRDLRQAPWPVVKRTGKLMRKGC